MENKYWERTPFKEESLFHENFDKKQSTRKLQAEEVVVRPERPSPTHVYLPEVVVRAERPSPTHIYFRKNSLTPETEILIPLRFSTRYRDRYIAGYSTWANTAIKEFFLNVLGLVLNRIPYRELKNMASLIVKDMKDTARKTMFGHGSFYQAIREMEAVFLAKSGVGLPVIPNPYPNTDNMSSDISVRLGAFDSAAEATVRAAIFFHLLDVTFTEFKLPVDFQLVKALRAPNDTTTLLDHVFSDAMATPIFWGLNTPSDYVGARAISLTDEESVSKLRSHYPQWTTDG